MLSLRGAIGAAVAMTCVGSLTAVSATLSRYPVYGGQAVRYAVAAAILLAIARIRDRGPRPRPSRRDLALIAGLAVMGLACFNIFIIEGTEYTGPATIGTVIGTVPIALAIAAPLMAGRRPAARTILAAVVVAAGAGLANGLGGGSALGLLLALGALAGEVCFSLLAIPLLPKLGPVRVSAYSAAAAAPMLFVTGLAVSGGGMLRAPTLHEAAALGYLTVVVTVGAFITWYDAIGRIGADRAGLFAGLIPISAVLTTMLLGLATPSAADLAGAALVATGVGIGLTQTRQKPPAGHPKRPLERSRTP